MVEIVGIYLTSGDAFLIILVISALAVAVQMIDRATQGAKGNPLKYDRRVIIVTDGRGEIDTQDEEQIATKLKDLAAPIELVLLGVDFNDADSGYKEENKTPQKVSRSCSSTETIAN